VDPAEFRSLPLEAHALLHDVPLHDVTVIELPGGGAGRTLADVRALIPAGGLPAATPVTRALFALRWWLGRLFGWDRARHDDPAASYGPRVSEELRARSTVAPGTSEGGFRLLYLLGRESLSEIRNGTVHAFLCAALREQTSGYRLYFGIYVKPVSRFTSVYMALIEPFRRFVVYPAMFSKLHRAWVARYGVTPPSPSLPQPPNPG
jgi:hypothetical protein